MNEQDIRVAVWNEAIEIAEKTAKEFDRHGVAGEVIARRMKARMVQELEETPVAGR